MFDQLLDLIQQNSQQAVVQNPAVPNEHNEDVMQTLMDSVTGGLKENAQNGNLQGLLGLFSGSSGTGAGLMNNPIIASIASNAITAIMNKFGLSSSAAGNIVASVLPGVLGSLISKTSNPGDSSIDFNSVLGGLLGADSKKPAGTNQTAGFDFNQIGYALADGKLDMNDLIRVGGSLFGGNAPASNTQQGGLDLGGMLGGLFGNR
jgi:hypothetical protein